MSTLQGCLLGSALFIAGVVAIVYGTRKSLNASELMVEDTIRILRDRPDIIDLDTDQSFHSHRAIEHTWLIVAILGIICAICGGGLFFAFAF
ncbi:MAG: hypothetical protein U0526_01745 [Candidatus Saccharibacteria bacterium]|jgi:uncharacterized membrane protein HdeD (DUF308 family)